MAACPCPCLCQALCPCMHCIATLWLWVGIQPISSLHAPYPAYMCSLLCLPLATLHPSSPQDTCGLSGLPHMAYCLASHLVWPVILSGWSSCQDPMLTVRL